MKKQKLNVRLLRKVQKHILEEPRRLDMAVFKQESDHAPCGTTACIAGWTTTLSGVKCSYGLHARRAEKLLGIPPLDSMSLFNVPFWPARFEARYAKAKSDRGRARVTSDRIDAFIAGDR